MHNDQRAALKTGKILSRPFTVQIHYSAWLSSYKSGYLHCIYPFNGSTMPKENLYFMSSRNDSF